MTASREQHGSCLIETDALHLNNGEHWTPWLKLTRCADGVSASRVFDKLKPVFGTKQAALHYAAELGRSLVDEKSALDPARRHREPALRRPHQTFARECADGIRAQALAFANLVTRATE